MSTAAVATPGDASPSRAPSPVILTAVALGGCIVAGGVAGLALASEDLDQPRLRAALYDWIILPYVLAGILAWWRRPASGLGRLLVAAGFATAASGLIFSNAALTHTIGEALDFLPPVVFLHVFLAYPTGRLRNRLEQMVVGAAYVMAIAVQLVVLTLSDQPWNVLEVLDAPAAAAALQNALLFSLSAIMLAGIGILGLRRWREGRPFRRSLEALVDSFALGLVMIAALFLSNVYGGPGVDPIRHATFVVIGIAPVVFLVALLQARLARSGVAELVVELRERPEPAEVSDALARAARDPSLTLAYWLSDYRTWADLDGWPIALPAEGSGRAMTVIEEDGVPVAALLHDAALNDEPELLESVRAAAAFAVENGRLQAELRARLEEVRGSRARIVAATQAERQRLERNLHDGAQQRLIALSLELGRIADKPGAGIETRARLDEARREIASSLEELRDVARGLHPAVVSAHGLLVALEQLAAGAPVPATLHVDVGRRLDESVEIGAYYVVSESLANVGKHAGASSVRIEVATDGGRLLVEVVDDGVGGANTERGSGLRGLADRVEALGGTLRVWSPHDGGTRVRAEIPCVP